MFSIMKIRSTLLHDIWNLFINISHYSTGSMCRRKGGENTGLQCGATQSGDDRPHQTGSVSHVCFFCLIC